MFLLNKLKDVDFWERHLRDRLAEPIHLNLISIFVQLFGSFRAKVAFDLVERRRYAFALLKAADYAKAQGIKKIYALEFGIAAGAGLVNLAWLAKHITKDTGVEIGIVGFDTGTGMPRPLDYRDYPEEFIEGDFPLPDPEALKRNLPPEVRVIYGPAGETARGFVETLDAPVGFVSLDLAYYSSTVDAMQALLAPADKYLPMTLIYLGAVLIDNANPAVGELLAVKEFNELHRHRQVHPFNCLRDKRIFKNGMWHHHIYTLHVLDHAKRAGVEKLERKVWVLDQPYNAAEA
ncbi:MAG: hypothetical protein U1E17_01680 [Geminicoccaceae bacterium]